MTDRPILRLADGRAARRMAGQPDRRARPRSRGAAAQGLDGGSGIRLGDPASAAPSLDWREDERLSGSAPATAGPPGELAAEEEKDFESSFLPIHCAS